MKRYTSLYVSCRALFGKGKLQHLFKGKWRGIRQKITARHVCFLAREVRICASHHCFGDFSSRFIFAGNPGYKEKRRRPPPACRYFAHTWILLPCCAKTPNESGFWGSREIKQRCCCLHRCCCCSSNILRSVFFIEGPQGHPDFPHLQRPCQKVLFFGKICVDVYSTALYISVLLSVSLSPFLPFHRGSNGDT